MDKKNKKLVLNLGLPILCVSAIVIIYFGFKNSNSTNQISKTQNENLELGTSSEKAREFPNSKVDNFDIVDKDEEAKRRERSQGFDNVIGNPLGTEEKDPQAELVRKQLEEITRTQSQSNTNIASRSNSSSLRRTQTHSPSQNPRTSKREKEEIFVRESSKEFEDFFENSDKLSLLEKEITPTPSTKNESVSVLALVNYDQTIKDKTRVELILAADVKINGKLYKKNTYIYGSCSFGSARLNITISKINDDYVSLSAYDYQDGKKGLYVDPENLATEINSEGTQDVIDEINVQGLPVGNTIKNIFKKRQRESEISLLNNYKIILKS